MATPSPNFTPDIVPAGTVPRFMASDVRVMVGGVDVDPVILNVLMYAVVLFLQTTAK